MWECGPSCSPGVPLLVAQEDCSTIGAEDAVGHQHAAICTRVPVVKESTMSHYAWQAHECLGEQTIEDYSASPHKIPTVLGLPCCKLT